MRASFTRISRKASRTQRRKNAAIANSTGAEPIENSASRQSRPKIATKMKERRTTSPTRLTSPEANISFSDSMSLVSRVMRRPTGVRSKNEADSDRMWRWARVRRSFIPSCPSTWVRYSCAKPALYCPTSASRYSTASRSRPSSRPTAMCSSMASLSRYGWAISSSAIAGSSATETSSRPR